jgi:hypothetical protein
MSAQECAFLAERTQGSFSAYVVELAFGNAYYIKKSSSKEHVMRVRRTEHAKEPGYPNRRQFLEYKTLAGVAVIGLSTVVGGCRPARTVCEPVRTVGVPIRTSDVMVSNSNDVKRSSNAQPVAPSNTTAVQPPEGRLGGEIMVVPK